MKPAPLTLALVLAPVALGFLSASASAATLARYEFNGGVLTAATEDAHTDAANVVWGAGLPDAGARGFGAGNQSLYARSSIVNETLSATSTDYVGFTLSAVSGYELDLGSISFTYGFSHGTAGGTPVQQATFSLRSSVDGFANDIASFTRSSVASNSDFVTSGPISLSAPAYQNLNSITFRLFLSDDGVSTTTHTLRLDDFDVQGLSSVAAVPEPASFAALLAMCSGMLVASRRRRP